MNNLKISLIFLTVLIIFLFNCNTVPDEEEEKILNPIIAQFLGTANDMSFFWGRSGTSLVEWHQSFELSSNSTCSAVELKLGTRNGTPTGDYTIRIETNSTDRPSGNLADPNATKTISVSSLTDSSWNKWTFNSSFNLISGTTYWIVCDTTEPAVADNRMQVKGDSIITYSSGDAAFYVNESYIDTYDNQDMCFKVYR